MKIREENFAFIDGQNVNLGIQQLGWKLGWKRFRIYLREKYGVKKAYYFVGYVPGNEDLYNKLLQSDYILVFKPIIRDHLGHVKGNVDADLVLCATLKMNEYKKAVIVSGDGDFYSLVNHLYKNDRLQVVLAPCKRYCSSLLKKTAKEKLDFLDNSKTKLIYTEIKKHR